MMVVVVLPVILVGDQEESVWMFDRASLKDCASSARVPPVVEGDSMKDGGKIVCGGVCTVWSVNA